jgi:hypothetical protein
LGAISINALKSWATKEFPDFWLLILGTLFILVVLFLPGGLVSLPARVKALRIKWSAPAASAGVSEVPLTKTGTTEELKG